MLNRLVKVLLILLISNLNAQFSDIRFNEIYTKDRYTKSSVYYIYQDSKEILWFGSQDGLLKYNGYNLKAYKNDPFKEGTLSDNWIQTIAEDTSGNLWLGSYSGGAFLFDHVNEKFTNYVFDESDSNSISGNRIWTIFIDSKSRVWFGTSTGLSLFDRQKNSFKNFFATGEPTYQNAVNSIVELPNGDFYVGTWGNGLFRFSTSKMSFEPIFKNIDYQLWKIKALLLQNEKTLWIATYGGGLVKLNTLTKDYKIYRHEKDNKNSLADDLLQNLMLYDDNSLWIGTHDAGLSILDIKNEKFYNEKSEIKDPYSISDNWIGAIYKDINGIVWIGSGVEIQKFLPRNQNFNILNLTLDQTQRSNVSVNSISEDTEGNLWIGTWGEGLKKYSHSTKKFSVYNSKNSPLQSDIVWNVYNDRDDNLWVGTYTGLCYWQKGSPQMKLFTSRNSGLSHNNVSSVFEDSRGNIWIGTWGGGLNLFNRDKNEFTVYSNSSDDPFSISEDIISTIFEDSKGNLWIGTNGGGLNKFNYEEDSFISYQYDKTDLTSLSNNYVKTIAEDKNGNLWIGTWGGGVNKLNEKDQSFEHITEKEGLSSNIIFGIIPFGSELWISTNYGLSRYNTETESFVVYDGMDGLASSEFFNGYHKGRSGNTLYFGGLNGLTYFNPKDIWISDFNPKVIITSFKVFNKPAPLKNEQNHSIRINYNENFFTFEFSALDYSRPDKIDYAFMIEGFDKDWIAAGNKRSATYTNLDPGEYTFKVKATNSDGIWSNSVASVNIYIVPPFWRTMWFRLLLVMIAILIFATFYTAKVRSVRIRNQLLESQVAERTSELKNINENLQNEILHRKRTEQRLVESEKKLKELNADKDKFFSIIAHDLKSPFTSLLGFASFLDSDIEKLSKEDIRSFAKDISNDSRKLFNLLENLLNWSTVQLGRLNPNPQKLEMKNLAVNLINILEGKAKNKNISIENEISNNCSAYADEMMVSSTIQNLLSNAIKFTETGGKIIISSDIHDDEIEISVRDTGIGMSSEDVGKLFKIDERSTKIGKTNKNKGTGLGLILCKEFIELNKGRINVESRLGEGTTFSFTLPKYKEELILN